MVSLQSYTSRVGDVTLVEVLVTAETPTRIQLHNRLDGPVWPPRRQGVPVEGWDADGFEGTVDERLVCGYATPAEPTESPVEIVSAEPIAETASGDEPTPEELVRSLGDARPPRAAVDRSAQSTDTGGSGHAKGDHDDAEAETTPSAIAESDTTAPPPAVAEWLEAVESRLATADRLAGASSVAEATAAVAEVGGADDVLTLREQLAADKQALSRVQSRASELSERVETIEIPAETLTRLT